MDHNDGENDNDVYNYGMVVMLMIIASTMIIVSESLGGLG